MFAIIDARSPEKSINKLKEHVDDLFMFQTNAITENSISGHPDIFIYRDKKQLVVAPNAPIDLFEFLDNHHIAYLKGERAVGKTLYNSVQYNCLGTSGLFFHKSGYTDHKIMKINKNKKFINLPQAYTRCSLVHLCKDNYLTSDRGIEKVLLNKGFSCFYFSPEEIIIHDHKNGFIGGAIGIWGKRIFFNGNMEIHADGQRLKEHLLHFSFEIVNLSDHYLYDGGCIFFV
ncbi:hypothetical protein SCALIN_C04_0049 [Candidatus Scalindua japonica]|uniref:DUF6873 domain-containing protein n=1 Tax=Candidatus Scalindua japonica TaxID=1284222 RepID=A0A286TUN6_9BACT|nr:hypothetical protein [Candidatus Scalindua japonica]GAX59561.1 hypothetical protein SCALIN_C04_0049 [Candidatus Scalindua japonica]